MIAYLARIELRGRWRSMGLLAILVALVVGTVLTAVAGARRSDSAFDRYLDAMRPADVGVFGNDPEVLDEVAGLPHVETSARVELAAIVPSERSSEEFYPMLVSLDGQLPYDHMRPKVVSGRLPDPDEPLEVALTERTARQLGKRVGDRLPMAGYSPEGVLAEFEGQGSIPGPDGPSFDLDVVGVVRDALDLVGRETDLTITFLTPAFRERYPSDAIGDLGSGAFVVLDDPSSLGVFARAAAPLGVDVDTSIVPAEAQGQASPTVGAIATALYVFAAVVAIAGAAAVAQAFGRSLLPAAADLGTLEALGVSRVGRWAGLVAPRAGALALGVVAGVLLAIAASPAMPVGLARRAEPNPGVDVDVTVLALGSAVALVVLLGLVAMTAASTARRARSTSQREQPSRLARRAAEAGASPSISIGLGFASAGRSATAAASRTALGGVTVGVVGIVAASVFAASVDRLVSSPELYGWGWDANIAGADLSDLPDGAVDVSTVLEDDDLTAVAEVVFQVQATIDGAPTYARVIDDRKGRVEAVMVRGRQPSGPGEVALAGRTADDVDRAVGDAVAVDLGHGSKDLTLTGVVTLPVSEDGGASSSGALLTGAAAADLGFDGDCVDDAACYRNIAVAVRDGADPATVLARHTSEADRVTADFPSPPGEVERLTAVERMPWLLAGFLGLLAMLAVVHSAVAAVRRRRRDLSVLQVLGFTGRQVRAVVTTQVAAISVVGATVGALLGIVVGRVVWRGIVDGIPMPYSPAVPVGLIALVVMATVALAQIAAVGPLRSASRLRTADVLRAE